MACSDGKSGSYATLLEALEVLKNVQQTSNREVKPTRAYACYYCRRWHLTSQPKRNPRRSRRRR
jgi:hypothetical protein